MGRNPGTTRQCDRADDIYGLPTYLAESRMTVEQISAVKGPEEVWLVGLAAETVGVTSARREVTIQSDWDNR